MTKVYLAGPITGLSYTSANEWRLDVLDSATKDGRLRGCEFFSPLRGKKYLTHETVLSDNYPQHAMSSSKAIMQCGYYDVQTADALIVNFIGASTVSIGTVMEVAWAHQRRIPVIAIMEDGNVHEHSMMNEAIWWKVTTVNQALELLATLIKS